MAADGLGSKMVRHLGNKEYRKSKTVEQGRQPSSAHTKGGLCGANQQAARYAKLGIKRFRLSRRHKANGQPVADN